jgi:tRNA threonylcarbamoyladenosine biosynthesis protein TsaB
MLVLVVESSTDTAAVALADEDGPLGSTVTARGRRHTETIAPAIDALCSRVGVALGDLDLLGVDVGPGLFTGLRVGVGTVQALSFALDLPVVPATSLEVLAHALARSGRSEGSLLVPVVDARRGEVFSGRFRVGSGSAAEARLAVPEPLSGAGTPGAGGSDRTLWSPDALASELARLSEPFLLAGDGALRYRSLFDPLPGVTLAGPDLAAPPVTALADLCLIRGLAGGGLPGAGILPRYLRQADATINWDQRIAPRAAAGAGG